MIDKNLILITYLQSIIKDYKFKSEYSTNDNDIKVIIVQETVGEKEVLFGDKKLNNYFQIQIFGTSIREQKATSVVLGNLIGENVKVAYNGNTYQILFQQLSNPQSIVYEDIRRVGYTLTLKTIIEKIGG
jgi:isocitrate dehydrogenase kinase/phosphatase